MSTMTQLTNSADDLVCVLMPNEDIFSI